VTANRTVARLKKSGLATSKPHGPIELTMAGFKLAEKSKRRHAIVLAILVALGVSPDNARKDAEGIEHHVSDETCSTCKPIPNGNQRNLDPPSHNAAGCEMRCWIRAEETCRTPLAYVPRSARPEPDAP
jgi:Mn-dependent DtxR family transcriptional regulator